MSEKLETRTSSIFTLHGDPVALARARSGKWRHYDPQKELKQHTRIDIEGQIPQDFVLFSGPVLLRVDFYLALPKRKLQPFHKAMQPHFFKPDLSNLIKYVEDCCTQLLFQDDCSIAGIISYKYYDSVPRTEFRIAELEYNGRK